MYYKKHKLRDLDRLYFGNLEYWTFTRKNWNLQHRENHIKYNWKRRFHKLARRSTLYSGNYYRKVGDYQWTIN